MTGRELVKARYCNGPPIITQKELIDRARKFGVTLNVNTLVDFEKGRLTALSADVIDGLKQALAEAKEERERLAA